MKQILWLILTHWVAAGCGALVMAFIAGAKETRREREEYEADLLQRMRDAGVE